MSDPNDPTSTSRPWLVASGLALASVVVYVVRLLLLDAPDRAAMIPDDAFYYLTLAQHFVQDGAWSFDGLTVTSGFHPLYAYLLTPLAAVFQGRQALLDAATLLSVLLSLGTFVIAARASVRARRFDLLVAATVVLGSAMVGLLVTVIMEWALVVVFAALFWRELGKNDGRLMGVGPPWRAALWAFLLVLSRSDAIVLVGVVSLWELGWQIRARRIRLVGALPGFAAVVAWCLVGLHSVLVTDTWLQDSAAAKLAWAAHHGASPGPILTMVAQVFVPFELRFGLGLPGPVRLAIALGILVGGWLAYRALARRAATATAPTPTIGVASTRLTQLAALVCVAYVGLYSLTVALDTWYTAHFIVPAVLVIAWLVGRLHRLVGTTVLAGLVLVYLTLHALTLHRMDDHRAAQRPLLALALASPEPAPGERVGSFNAGLVGFYEGGDVVNLDGLVNHEIAAYRDRGALACYFVDRRITRLHELDVAGHGPELWASWGDPHQHLTPVLRELAAWPGPNGTRAVIYAVDIDSLAPGCR